MQPKSLQHEPTKVEHVYIRMYNYYVQYYDLGYVHDLQIFVPGLSAVVPWCSWLSETIATHDQGNPSVGSRLCLGLLAVKL